MGLNLSMIILQAMQFSEAEELCAEALSILDPKLTGLSMRQLLGAGPKSMQWFKKT
jgi:hypothetical protein